MPPVADKAGVRIGPIFLKPRNRPAAHICVTAANLRKRLLAMITPQERLALLVIGELRLLRPILTPSALARSRPSSVRARINSRSNSARPPSTVSISRPCAVVVSAHVSCSERKPAPLPVIDASVFKRSRVERAKAVEARDGEHVTLGELADVAARWRFCGLVSIISFANRNHLKTLGQDRQLRVKSRHSLKPFE
jgi:hypothetical protein